MPSYTVEAPNGVKFDVEGDSPPTEQELNEIFNTVSPSKASPIAEQEAFKQQFIEAGTQDPLNQALSALGAPVKATGGIVGTLADILYKGARGAGSMAQKAADANELALSQPGFLNKMRALVGEQAGQVGDVLQTAGEVGPRTIAEIINAARQGFQSPQAAESTLRGLNAVANPFQAALQALITPKAAPTQAQAQQAFEENLVNQARSQSLDQPILQAAQESVGLPVSTETNIDVSRALPALIGAEALPVAIARTAARITPTLQRVITSVPRAVARVTPTSETAGMSALNLAKEEVQAILPSAVPNITKAAGKALPNADEILQAAPKARKTLFDDTIGGLTKAKEEGLVAKGGSAVDDAIEAIQSDARYMTDSPDQATALIKKYEKYRRDLDPLEAQKLLEDTNAGLSSHWDKSAKGQKLDLTDAELRAERALASNLSGQVDELYQIGSKTFNDPYRQIGKIIELEKNLKLTKATAEKAFAERVSPSRRSGGSIPLGKGEVIRKGSRSLTSAFKNTELELLDKNLKGAFKGAPQPLKSVPIPEETLPGLRRNYMPSKPPPPLPSVAPVVAPQTLAEIIKTFPLSLRRDPGMAKAAAQGILEGAPPVPKKKLIPETAPIAPQALPVMRDNYVRDLSDFSPTVHREMSPQQASSLLDRSDVRPREHYASNNPDLALGQKGNTGVLFEFNTEGLQGRVNTQKPGWDFNYSKGDAELIIKNANDDDLFKNIMSITIKPGIKPSVRMGSLLLGKVKSGWEKILLPDGSTKYIKPE